MDWSSAPAAPTPLGVLDQPMMWSFIADVAEGIGSAERWLHNIEPELWKSLPSAVRIPGYYIAAVAALGITLDLIRSAGWFIYRQLCLILDSAAQWVLFDFMDQVARLYVKLEAMSLRLRIFPVKADVRPTRRPEFSDNVPRAIDSVIVNVLRVSVAVLTVTLAQLLVIPFVILRAMLRPRPLNVLAWAAALWYAGLLMPAIRFIGQIRVGEIQLSVVVAVGTLFAVVYAAANSDVRGRAELNKTASLACRVALHGCTHPFLTIANSLSTIRMAMAMRLKRFPTRDELRELTGRKDLVWRRSVLLPRGAGRLPHDFRDHRLFQMEIVGDVLDDLPIRFEVPPKGPGTLAPKVHTSYEELITASRVARDRLDQLRDAGFTGKLDRVLNAPGRGMLEMVTTVDFGVDNAKSMMSPENRTWIETAVANPETREELVRTWSSLKDAEPDDPELRRACYSLTYLLRHLVRQEHAKHWLAAMTEQRLHYLAVTIDKSLRPRLIERVRQAFGK